MKDKIKCYLVFVNWIWVDFRDNIFGIIFIIRVNWFSVELWIDRLWIK